MAATIRPSYFVSSTLAERNALNNVSQGDLHADAAGTNQEFA